MNACSSLSMCNVWSYWVCLISFKESWLSSRLWPVGVSSWEGRSIIGEMTGLLSVMPAGYYFLYKFVLVELKVVLGVLNAYTQVFVVVDIMERTNIISHHCDDFLKIFNISFVGDNEEIVDPSSNPGSAIVVGFDIQTRIIY